MRFYSYLLVPILSVSLSISVSAESQSVNPEQEILDVVNSFREAIVEKDREKFKSLFYDDNPPFVAVFGKEMLTVKRKENPAYPSSINFSKFGNSIENMISDEDNNAEEVITDVKVHADHYIGTAYFNYLDMVDGKQRAFGTEAWSLVKHEGKWLIVSVIFNVNENPNF